MAVYAQGRHGLVTSGKAITRVSILLGVAMLQTAAAHKSKTISLGRITDTSSAFAATTQLLGPSGELRGTAALTATDTGTRVVAQLEGLVPGPYAIDLHNAGRCEAAGFAAAGDSIARSANVIAGVDGRATIELTIDGRPFVEGLRPVLGATGAAVILDAAPRDGHGAVAIACGALAPHQPASR